MNAAMSDAIQAGGCWVLDVEASEALVERLGDARNLADQIQASVGVCIVGQPPAAAERIIQQGADHLIIARTPRSGQNTLVAAAATILGARRPRVVFSSGDPCGRECGLRLAARCGWQVASPALSIRRSADGGLMATVLDATGKLGQEINVAQDHTLLATFRPGVAAACAADSARKGNIEIVDLPAVEESVLSIHVIPADPLNTDIRHVQRLIAGGRGLGSAAGFELLRRVAAKLNAGIAASRAVVDLGWVDHELQVGQTGKTVKPDLYIACGISGASHHLDGMSESAHIVAINSDPHAPIHAKTHLSLVADLHEVLARVEQSLHQ